MRTGNDYRQETDSSLQSGGHNITQQSGIYLIEDERMSLEVLVGAVGQAVSAYIGTENQKTQAIFGLAYGLGSQLGVLLPYSRKHEYEADRLGLIIMAMAGYDINVAPKFWETMSSSGANQPEFITTHPSDENRIKQIIAILPEAAKFSGTDFSK